MSDIPHPPQPIAVPALLPESFWSILLRRGKYVVAIALSAFLFLAIGWRFAAPPPVMAGISLLAWSPAGAPFAAAAILLLLILIGLLSTLIVHPDAPHMGLFCAILGMAALSIRGGTSHMLLQAAQLSNTESTLAKSLAFECLLWAAILLIAEALVRPAHGRFFHNTHWIARSAPPLSEHALKPFSQNGGGHIGVSRTVSRALHTDNLPRALATPLAMIYSGLVAILLLYALLQSQLKGQVLFACFAAFFVATANAYLAFPKVPVLEFLLAVLLTAAVGYFIASSYNASPYPGQGSFFISRALPIDFFVAGVPGAILGYYTAVRWALHSDDPS